MTAAAREAVREAATDSVTFGFGDATAQLYGLARLGLSRAADGMRQGSALALLFAGREPVAALAHGALPVGEDAGWETLALAGVRATVEEPLERWNVSFDAADGQGFALEFSALGDAAELGAAAAAGRLGGMAGYDQPCRVRGSIRAGGRERPFDGLGQRGHSWGDADWERIELARTVTAWSEGGCASLTAVRPAGAHDHDEEATWAALWEPDDEQASRNARQCVLEVDQGRLSTTYDADGNEPARSRQARCQRRSGISRRYLWSPVQRATSLVRRRCRTERGYVGDGRRVTRRHRGSLPAGLGEQRRHDRGAGSRHSRTGAVVA